MSPFVDRSGRFRYKPAFHPFGQTRKKTAIAMRAEIETTVHEIKQSLELLRRHL